MIQLIKNIIIPYVINDVKIYLAIISLLFFTLLYSICENDEFHGWVNSKQVETSAKKKFLETIFAKYSDTDGLLSLENFLKIPLVMRKNKFYLENDKNIKDIKKFLKNKEMLFKIFDSDGNNKMNEKTFLKLPINLDNITDSSLGYKTTYPGKNKKGKAVNTMFDRLYFSIVIQSNLGMGDIYPASRRVRIIMMLQILFSYSIIVLPYGKIRKLK